MRFSNVASVDQLIRVHIHNSLLVIDDFLLWNGLKLAFGKVIRHLCILIYDH